MAEHNDLGQRGEVLAKKFLQDNGLTILEENWRIKKAEIDIIAKDEKTNTLIIVEVKTRSYETLGSPENFVTEHKQKMLFDAASIYAEKLGHEWEVRFDIIAIILNNKKEKITHFEDAFFPNNWSG